MLRQLLVRLHETEDAPRLWMFVPKVAAPRPRNVTIKPDEKASILARLGPAPRLWILLCSDLALRSATALKIGPEHYNRHNRTITCKTKFGAPITLPVTEEIASIFEAIEAKGQADGSYVASLTRLGKVTVNYLRQQFKKAARASGITRDIRPHDFRRTTAVNVLNLSHDLRLVQAVLGHTALKSTLHYLDHNATPVTHSTLELAKLQSVSPTIH